MLFAHGSYFLVGGEFASPSLRKRNLQPAPLLVV